MDQNEKIESTTLAKSSTSASEPAVTKVCRTVTLFDEPEATDGFGSHQKVAQAIAALIEPDDAKGIGIGIEGPWGSGKSTVARLLENELKARLAEELKEEKDDKKKVQPSLWQRISEKLRRWTARLKGDDKEAVNEPETQKDNRIVIVKFDAWAHEGDPLRRTFLEAIINKLQAVGWVRKSHWDLQKKILANQRVVVSTEDELKITRWGRAIIIMLPLIPIGGAFLTAALREPVTLAGGEIAEKFVVLFSLGLLISFSPIFVLLVGIKKDQDLLSLFLNKGPTRKSTVTNRTANPTSIEFEESFTELLEEALKIHGRRIVLILDNLDRVEAKDALSIWSTLQTFLQHKGTDQFKWRERLWFLFLYDYSGLSQLWAKGENPSGGKQDGGEQDDGDEDVENLNDETESGGNAALSFIDKSFQVRFEVPPLVLSDWRTFLTRQLKEAFPNHFADERHEVYRVLSTNVNNRSLTIRELKLFVNQIGAIHRQWAGVDPADDTFGLPLIAYYVLLRRSGAKMLKLLLNPNWPPVIYQDLLGSDIRENFAAIFFNVEAAAARQLLFSDRIKKALTEGDPKELKNVASLLSKGFWDVFEKIAKDWSRLESLRVADAALALEESELAKSADVYAFRTVMRAFSDRVGSLRAWTPLTDTKARGLGVILKWKKELADTSATYEAFATKLFEAIALGLNDQATDPEQSGVAEEWLANVNSIVKGLEVTTKQAALTKLVETVATQFTSADLQPAQLERCLEVLTQLGQNADISANVEKQLRDLIDKKAIENELLKATGKKSAKQVALMIYVLVRYSSTFTGIPTSISSPDNRRAELSALISDAVVQSFAELLEKYQQTSLLFTTLQASEDTKPLAVGSLKLALDKPEARDLFSGPNAIDRLEFAFSELGTNDEVTATLSVLLAEIQKQSNVALELTARKFEPRSANLYLQILQSGSPGKDFVSWCVQGLRLASLADWETDLYRRGPLLALAFRLNSVTEGLELGEQYFKAVKKILSRMDDQEWAVLPHKDENLVALVGPLGSDDRTSLQRSLMKYIESWTGDYPSWLFPAFGQELLIQLDQASWVADLLEKIFAPGDRSALEWIREALAQRSKTLETKYKNKPEWIRFKAAVRRALMFENRTTETFPLVRGIADALNVKEIRNGDLTFTVFDEAKIYTRNLKTYETKAIVESFAPDSPRYTQPVWSPDGTRLAYTLVDSASSNIFVFDPGSRSTSSITQGSNRSSGPSWSPDGKDLVFVREDGPNSHILKINLETRKEQQLTTGTGRDEHPSWSPDGKRIVFHHSELDVSTIRTVSDFGENRVYEGRSDLDPSWHPNSNEIVFTRGGSEGGIMTTTMNTYPKDSLVKLLISESDAHLPVWSPDGKFLFYQSGSGESAEIYQVDADGKNKKFVIAGIDPCWRPLLESDPDETSESPSGPPAKVDAPPS